MSPAEVSSEDEAGDVVMELDVHPDENVGMSIAGHLREWAPDTQAIRLFVPPNAPPARLVDAVRLACNFPRLASLQLRYDSASYRVDSGVLGAAGELLGLQRLTLQGGVLVESDLKLHVLTGLKHLTELRLQTLGDAGIGDEHIIEGLAQLASLRALEFRGSAQELTDEGVAALAAGLTSLTSLTVTPLGLCVTRAGLSQLSRITCLRSLHVGLLQSGQLAALKDMERVPQLSLAVHDSGAELPPLLSTLTLCKQHQLVSLRLTGIKAHDATFMLALATLSALTSLSVAVDVHHRHITPHFSCDLAALAPLTGLKELDFAVTKRVGLPLGVKTASLLALAWPCLHSLSLSVMRPPLAHVPVNAVNISVDRAAVSAAATGGARRRGSSGGGAAGDAADGDGGIGLASVRVGVVPEALGVLDNFRRLRRLELFPPLDHERDDPEDDHVSGASGPFHVPVSLAYLPKGLTHLVLERASLQEVPASRRQSAAAAGAGSGHSSRAGSSGGGAAPQACMQQAPAAAAAVLQHTGSFGGAASGRASGSGRALLPALRHLELSDCVVGDEHVMTQLLEGASGLNHLELVEVRGISGASLAALSTLTQLKHLEVHQSEEPAPAWAAAVAAAVPPSAMDAAGPQHTGPAHGVPKRSSSSGSGGGGGGSAGSQHTQQQPELALHSGGSSNDQVNSSAGQGLVGWLSSWAWPAVANGSSNGAGASGAAGSSAAAGPAAPSSTPALPPQPARQKHQNQHHHVPYRITNRALQHVGALGSLRHLEWSVGMGMTQEQLLLLVPGLSNLGNCRYMYLSLLGALRADKRSVAEDASLRLERPASSSGGSGAANCHPHQQQRPNLAWQGMHGQDLDEDALVEGLARGLIKPSAWRGLLEARLPMCCITTRAPLAVHCCWDGSNHLSIRH